MSYKLIFLFIIPLMLLVPFQEPPHYKHQWNHRVLLVITSNTYSSTFLQQIEILNNKVDALNERKLIIYQIHPEGFKRGLKEHSNWIDNQEWYRIYADEYEIFEIQLYGLDGGRKLYQNDLLTIEKLLETIDAMPMRRSEMYRKN